MIVSNRTVYDTVLDCADDEVLKTFADLYKGVSTPIDCDDENCLKNATSALTKRTVILLDSLLTTIVDRSNKTKPECEKIVNRFYSNWFYGGGGCEDLNFLKKATNVDDRNDS